MKRRVEPSVKRISVTTAILAVFAALASLQAGNTVNMALALKTEAVQLQAQASDQWAYYQAKGIKAAVLEASRTSWLAMGKEPPPDFAQNMKRYEEEQAGIMKTAKEKERDLKTHESEHLLHKHHGFARAVSLFQISIALGAVAALTRSRFVWIGSLIAGAAGLVFFVLPMLR